MTVIRDLEELQPSIFSKDFQGRRACIDRIFNQFLQGVNRRDDDFPCGYLIDHILIESLAESAEPVVRH